MIMTDDCTMQIILSHSLFSSQHQVQPLIVIVSHVSMEKQVIRILIKVREQWKLRVSFFFT
jgi:hypothetical protein